MDGQPVERFSALFLEIVNGNSLTIERDGALIEQEIPVDFIATLLEDEEKARFLGFRQPFVVQEISSDSPQRGVLLCKKETRWFLSTALLSIHVDQADQVLSPYKGQKVEAVYERNGALLKDSLLVTDEAKLGIALKPLTMQEYVDKGLMSIEPKNMDWLNRSL